MRAVRDTFLHFLADNLTGVTVHPVRREIDRPDSDRLQMNAVNVQFLNIEPRVHVASQMVSIDVINDNELTALDWVSKVWEILNKAFYTPKYDYTVPASPVATGDNIMWEPDGVGFRKVTNDYYAHFSCFLELKHILS